MGEQEILVAEKFMIDEDILYAFSRKDEYWAKCLLFYRDVAHKTIHSLTEKQINWLEKMELQLKED